MPATKYMVSSRMLKLLLLNNFAEIPEYIESSLNPKKGAALIAAPFLNQNYVDKNISIYIIKAES